MANTTDYFKQFLGGLERSLGANFSAVPTAILLAILCYVVYKVTIKIFTKVTKKLPIDANIVIVLKNVIKVFIIFFSTMIIASALGINTSSLIAAFSIFGLAISLAVQNVVANVANAINIYVNPPFKIGDYVAIGQTEGTVKEISFMFTKILTYKNEMIFIPNSTVGSSIIINYSSEKYRMVEYTIGVAYESDPEIVKKALMEVMSEEPLVIKSEPMIVFIDQHAASSINYTYRAYTDNSNYLQCSRSLRMRIKPKFDSYGINIPYNQLDVFLKK